MKKYSYIMIVLAALILEAVGTAQYFLARQEVTRQITQKASVDMAENKRIAAVRAEVETVMRNAVSEVMAAIPDPNLYYGISTRLVVNNPHVVGAGIAFRPSYYARLGKEKLYAPYAYRAIDKDNIEASFSKAEVRANLLSFDYTQREWFVGPMQSGKAAWTEPYADQAGTYIVMCTYSIPLKARNGNYIGVVFADVALKDISSMASGVYQGMDRSGMVIMLMQVIGLLALLLIIWRARSDFRNYKETVVDPEKQHLEEKVAKLMEINRRLTDRNMELAKKIQTADQQGGDSSQSTQWYTTY